MVAIDVAEQLIAYAKRHEEERPLGIEYHVVSASQVAERLGDRSLQLVTSFMAVHDMPDVVLCQNSAGFLQ